MKPESNNSQNSKVEPRITIALCGAVLLSGFVEYFVRNQPTYADKFAPSWLPFVAVGLSVTGIIILNYHPRLLLLQQLLNWSGLLLMVWTANGLPIDLLRVARLIPLGVDWLGLVTRMLALAATVVLVRPALARPAASASTRVATWYGYAAFALALTYPVIKTWWALGGTLGLMWPGAAGYGIVPWLPSIPWLLAASLSLLLVPMWRWMPRRLLLVAGWSATAVVAMVGPAACWSLVTTLVSGSNTGLGGIATWIPGLFYGSWLLWAIAAGAATRSYQLRSAALRMSPRASSAIKSFLGQGEEQRMEEQDFRRSRHRESGKHQAVADPEQELECR